ncbi:hypothetical protein HDV00_009257 [Rhizophlyctis rosea]|nr:hypothetical protein HDV00_009257 [Rhizophlyctis rosea]
MPFKNQVGGHASFLRFSDKALCKPLDPREKNFYELIGASHPELKAFIATYLGFVNVTYSTNETEGVSEGTPVIMLDQNRHILGEGDDYFSSRSSVASEEASSLRSYHRKLQQQVFRDALSPKSLRARFAQLKASTPPPAIRSSSESIGSSPLKRHSFTGLGSSEDVGEIFQMSDDEDAKGDDHRTGPKGARNATNTAEQTTKDQSPLSPKSPTANMKYLIPDIHDYNPWSLHCYNNQLSKFRARDDRVHQFMLLEDLTDGLKSPCILDLKMGTRQHGVNVTPEKKASQEKKCEKSTSKKLGVRICGMQVYKKTTHSFTYLDKYAGRQINIVNFKQSLLSFLDDGESYLIGYIPKLLEKLRQLHDCISNMSTYRFYASSLLILYDGAWTEDGAGGSGRPRDVDLKMIDFSHCVANADRLKAPSEVPASPSEAGSPPVVTVPYPPTKKGPDSGYLLGLRTLIRSFEDLYRELGGGGVNVDANGHVSKRSLSRLQRVSTELGSPIDLLMPSGSALPQMNLGPHVSGSVQDVLIGSLPPKLASLRESDTPVSGRDVSGGEEEEKKVKRGQSGTEGWSSPGASAASLSGWSSPVSSRPPGSNSYSGFGWDHI